LLDDLVAGMSCRSHHGDLHGSFLKYAQLLIVTIYDNHQ
jgi:hypothetical protein